MLSGRLLYTAITRAKDEVALIGESYAFEAACKKLDNKPRKTLLVELLSQNQRRTKAENCAIKKDYKKIDDSPRKILHIELLPQNQRRTKCVAL
jgi:ATP-dependent exoDNAse (exonuclease V) beta subunit